MNDLEKMEKLFDELGIEYFSEKQDRIKVADYKGSASYDHMIRISEGVGYFFCTEFYFLDGKFQNYGLWE